MSAVFKKKRIQIHKKFLVKNYYYIKRKMSLMHSTLYQFERPDDICNQYRKQIVCIF